ncbi:oil body-associated protein 1A-like [Impatiens glandulifera]|uniref:oil body-associated protein 1A-like n=1 Tax=Impatiens glandulifera TaxID=253017 RepID=UPI001FB19D63|nr:oil body-associated protein 1A-like [Impatiens glandulifera]
MAMHSSSEKIDVPGEHTQTGTYLLEKATATIQNFAPLKNIHQHLCAFHFYADDMTRQVEAHHYCGHLNEEMRQCLIYDGPDADSKLIGVEYIVTENIFMTLPDEEKPMWHSHAYEVKSGVLFMPGMPAAVQHMDLEKVAKTYGKTIHFWQVEKGDVLPLGIPQIMMALTRDGQLYRNLATEVENRYGVSFEDERVKRVDMKGPDHGLHPLANAAGKGLKTVLRETDCKPVGSVPRAFV